MVQRYNPPTPTVPHPHHTTGGRGTVIYVHTCMHTYMHAYIHTYIHAYIHTDTHTYIHSFIHSFIRSFIHSYTHIHTYLPTYLHTYLHTYIPTYHTIPYIPTTRHHRREGGNHKKQDWTPIPIGGRGALADAGPYIQIILDRCKSCYLYSRYLRIFAAFRSNGFCLQKVFAAFCSQNLCFARYYSHH